MAQAQVVYTDLNNGSIAMGTLFKGIKFWIAQRCPMRSSFVDQVKNNGGEVVPLEKHADILIVDHARKDIAPGTHSYTFIEQSIKKGELEDLDDHIAGPPTGSIRPVGSVRPTKLGRVLFTAEDDRVLREWVKGYQWKGGKVLGNEIYKQLEAVNNRHPWQSWRDRYVKYFSQSAQQSEMPDNGPPTPPLDVPAKPARLLRKSPPAPKMREDLKLKHPVDGVDDEFERAETECGSAEPLEESIMREVTAAGIRSKNPWTQADFDDLFSGAQGIEATPVQEYRQGWVKWGEAWRTHTIGEWRQFYEKVVYPFYRRSLNEEQVSQSQHKEDSETSPPSAKDDNGSQRKTNSTGFMNKGMMGAGAKDHVPLDEFTFPKANATILENTDVTPRRSHIVLMPTSSDRTASTGPSQHGWKRAPPSALLNSASPTNKRVRMDESVNTLIPESPSLQPRKRRRTNDNHVDSPSRAADEQEAKTVPGGTASIGGRASGVESLAPKVTFDDGVRHDGAEKEHAKPEPAQTTSPFKSTGGLQTAASKKNSDLRLREPSPMVEGVEMLDEIVGELEEEAAATNVQKFGLLRTSIVRENLANVMNLSDAGLPEEAPARHEQDLSMAEADDDWHELSSSVEDFQSAPVKVNEALSTSAQQLQNELEQPLSHHRQPTVESASSRGDEISSATQYVGLTEPSPPKPTEHSESRPSRDSLRGCSSVRSPQPSSPPSEAATDLETRALFDLGIENIDFDVPEPEGGFGELEEGLMVGIEEGEGKEAAEDGNECAGQEENEDEQDQAVHLRIEECWQQEMLDEEWEGVQHEERQEQEEEEEEEKEKVVERDEVAENGQQEMLQEERKGVQYEPRQEHADQESEEEEQEDTHYDPSFASRDGRPNAPTSPEAAARTDTPASATDEGLDPWLQLQYSRGYTEDEVAAALLSTSLQLELAEEVLVAMRSSGCIPRGMRGVWTDRDDEVLREADSGKLRTLTEGLMMRGRMRRLEDKHGEEEMQRRRAYWKTRRAVEQENTGG